MLFEEEDPRKRAKWANIVGPGLIGAGAGLMGYGAYKHYQDQHRWDPLNKGQLDGVNETMAQIGHSGYIAPEIKAKLQEIWKHG